MDGYAKETNLHRQLTLVSTGSDSVVIIFINRIRVGEPICVAPMEPIGAVPIPYVIEETNRGLGNLDPKQEAQT